VRVVAISFANGTGAFGSSPVYFYLQVLSVMGFAYLVFASLDPRRSWLPMVCALVLVGVHSALDHKEPRYVFAAHSLLVAAAAIGLALRPRTRTFAIRLSIAIAIVSMLRLGLVTDHYYQAAADLKAAFLALRKDSDLRALTIRDLEFGAVPGYFTLHRNLAIQLAELPPAGDAGQDDGFTHIAVPSGYPDIPGFSPWAKFGTVELRKRQDLALTAALPATSWQLPMTYIPGTGMRYRQ
jgi:hypothetical protein